jgi:ribosomal protein S18 acetylase RimI-like enzyme
MTTEIITPTAAELDALTDVGIRSFRDAFSGRIRTADLESYARQMLSREQTAAALQDPAVRFFLVRHACDYVGYAKLVAGPGKAGVAGRSPVELQKLYFLRAATGLGLGRALFDHCTAAARTAGHDVMWLDVWAENHGAIRFYERNGFTHARDVTVQVGEDRQRHLIYVRVL